MNKELEGLYNALLASLPHLAKSQAFGRLGDKLVDLSKQVGDLIIQRLDTDAGYAAGMRELAETAAWRRATLERAEKENNGLRDDLAEHDSQIGDAIVQLRALLTAAEDSAVEIPDAIRREAVAALKSVLKTLGAEPAEGEVVDPPEAAETHRGTAHCANGHTWPCVWTTMASPPFPTDGPIALDRIVFPPTCPACSGKWTEIETPDAPEEQPS